MPSPLKKLLPPNARSTYTHPQLITSRAASLETVARANLKAKRRIAALRGPVEQLLTLDFVENNSVSPGGTWSGDSETGWACRGRIVEEHKEDLESTDTSYGEISGYINMKRQSDVTGNWEGEEDEVSGNMAGEGYRITWARSKRESLAHLAHSRARLLQTIRGAIRAANRARKASPSGTANRGAKIRGTANRNAHGISSHGRAKGWLSLAEMKKMARRKKWLEALGGDAVPQEEDG
ncbi:hypothetical protein HDU93_000865 [Gonapodya sp. JEL0774]|nr:hypothetical protein HDU93_000865 [Gonapodya sp. JEL0774]